MRKILVIGVGPGDPEQVTVQAIRAMNRADVFFIPDKGVEKAGLRDYRLEICERYLEPPARRFVEFAAPPRAREKDETAAGYKENVDRWRAEIERIYVDLFLRELGESQCGAFLVWGDPSLYDSTLRTMAQIKALGAVDFDYEVVPGIMSVQALAARHKIALNRIGEPVQITTGRKLAEGAPQEPDSFVVMLNRDDRFEGVGDDWEIYWGANLGRPQEALASGKVGAVKSKIQSLRESVRRETGWILDIYLLRRPK